MLPRFKAFDQSVITNACNAFVNQLKPIYPQLEPLKSNNGSCFGLSFNYVLFSSNDRRSEFITYLQFFDALSDDNEFNLLVEHFKESNTPIIFGIDDEHSRPDQPDLAMIDLTLFERAGYFIKLDLTVTLNK